MTAMSARAIWGGRRMDSPKKALLPNYLAGSAPSMMQVTSLATHVRIRWYGGAGWPAGRRSHPLEGHGLREIALGESEGLALQPELVVFPLAADGEPEAVTLDAPADGFGAPA